MKEEKNLMNYLIELNSFYDWLETNSVPKSAISLWHALMHINNKANWVLEFAVAISVLEFKTGFKRSELFEARNILAQKGRIKWNSRGGNLSAMYEIIPFCVHNMDTNTYANGYTNPTQMGTQTGTINKLNKTKLNKTKLNKTSERDNNLPPEEVFLIEDLKNSLGSSSWIDEVGMKYSCTRVEINSFFENFCSDLILKGDEMKTEKDFKSHFVNWLKIQIKEKKKSSAKKEIKSVNELWEKK